MRWLAGAIAEQNQQGNDAPVGNAALRLLIADGARRPGHAWQLGAWLAERDVVDWDDRLATILEAQIDFASDSSWWTVLIELLAPISRGPPVHLLLPASRLTEDVDRLQLRLQALVNVIEVEAPHKARDVWRLAVADCAAESEISLGELGLSDELHPDIRPPRTWAVAQTRIDGRVLG